MNSKKKSAKSSKNTSLLKKTSRVFSRIISVLLTLLLIGVITGIIVATTFAVYCRDYLFDTDFDITDLRFNLDMTTTVYYPEYADIERTELLGYVEMEDQRIHGTENRFWAPVYDMPKNLKNAFIAIEDKRFYQHNGIDIRRTLGAALELLKGNKSYGGSTITQQLIKNITGDRDSTIQRKVTEISRAIVLTQKKTKSEVLEMYLNTIPLSHGNYGVAAAANYFFDKDVSDLTLIECAALAAIPKSPTKYDPERNPEDNKGRRNTVLFEMYDQKMITKEEYEEAINSELVLNINNEVAIGSVGSYFTDELRRQVEADLMEEYGYSKEIAQTLVLSGGLKIYATVDPYIQNILEEVYEDETTFKRVDDGLQPESAMVVLAPDTGDVLGVVGGRGEKTAAMTLNRATRSKRQIGSSIKPISVYAPAIDLGLINYGSVLDDLPVEFNEQMGRYWPRNAPEVYDGKVTVKKAIGVSKNTIAVKLVQELTPQYSYDFLRERLGVTSLVKSDIDESPMALGGLTYGLTTLETAGAYTALANNGVYSKPRFYTKVLDSKGNVLLEKGEQHNIAIDKSTSQIMTKLLCGVVEEGTATRVTLKNSIEVAAKTGTTNNDNDQYFVGYTPYYLGATWFGYDQNRTLAKFGGQSQALSAWDKAMVKIHERVFKYEREIKTFDYSDLIEAEYCIDTGLAPCELCYLDMRGSRVAVGYFKEGTEPVEKCDAHTVVKWNRETRSIACENCPPEDVGEVVLIKVGNERIFDHPLTVLDTPFTIMDLPDDYIYPDTPNTCIYANLAQGKHIGYTSKGPDDIPQNSYCTAHQALPETPNVPEQEEDNEEENPDNPVENGENEDDLSDIFEITDTPESDENEDNDENEKSNTDNTDGSQENKDSDKNETDENLPEER